MTCSRCGREIEVRTLRPRRGLVVALWALALGLAWWLAGGLLHDVAEGMETSLLPVWKLWVSVVALVSVVAATALRVHRPVCRGCRAGAPGAFVETADGSTRRAVLRVGGAAVAASLGGVAAAVGRNAGWKGRHAAALDFGDCMSYATAKLSRQPLLCTGGDFAGTDLAIA